jgi:hypothetical protein
MISQQQETWKASFHAHSFRCAALDKALLRSARNAISPYIVLM